MTAPRGFGPPAVRYTTGVTPPRWFLRIDHVAILLLLAQAPLLLASGLVGSALSTQAGAATARIAQNRAERQASIADSALEEARLQQVSLDRASNIAQELYLAEVAGTGPSQLPGQGALSQVLAEQARSRAEAAARQRALNATLANGARIDAERAKLTAQDADEVANQSIKFGIIMAAIGVALLGAGELLRTRREGQTLTEEQAWRRSLTIQFDELTQLTHRQVAHNAALESLVDSERHWWRFRRWK